MTAEATPRTLLDRIWDAHVVARLPGADLLYVDLHLLDDLHSPQAFAALRAAGRAVRRPEAAIAVPDHAVPTADRGGGIADAAARRLVETLAADARAAGVPLIPLDDPRQGIVHVVAPELGLSLPGLTIASGDSHAPTHGALGALAFGVGASEVEQVLATQTLLLPKPKAMAVEIGGALPPGTSAKDLALSVVAALGPAGATGHAVEFRGDAVRALGMAGRMTLCNLAVEAGARTALIAPDDTTFDHLRGRGRAPAGAAFDRAVAAWRGLRSDPGAAFGRVVALDATGLAPLVTWGTTPDTAVPVATGAVPDPDEAPDAAERARRRRMLDYMGLAPGQRIADLAVDVVFVGSCANGRIEDLREAAAVARGRRVAPGVRALVVPGSGRVKRQAEEEGLDRVLLEAGFEWREPGCSMCIGMNGDRVAPGRRCASTSNRNFEGRQGRGARTHLVSPATAAAAAIAGRFVGVRELDRRPCAAGSPTGRGDAGPGASARPEDLLPARSGPSWQTSARPERLTYLGRCGAAGNQAGRCGGCAGSCPLAWPHRRATRWSRDRRLPGADRHAHASDARQLPEPGALKAKAWPAMHGRVAGTRRVRLACDHPADGPRLLLRG